MVLGCLGRIHQLAHESPHKEGTLQQTKSKKIEGERLFFFYPSDEVLFVQGGCRAPSGTDGRREGVIKEGRVGRMNGYYTVSRCTNVGCLRVIVRRGGGGAWGGVKDLLWRPGVNHLSGTRQFYGSTCCTPAPLREEGGPKTHTFTCQLWCKAGYRPARKAGRPTPSTQQLDPPGSSDSFCICSFFIHTRRHTHVCLFIFSRTG